MANSIAILANVFIKPQLAAGIAGDITEVTCLCLKWRETDTYARARISSTV
jgi:hypothetical protein